MSLSELCIYVSSMFIGRVPKVRCDVPVCKACGNDISAMDRSAGIVGQADSQF